MFRMSVDLKEKRSGHSLLAPEQFEIAAGRILVCGRTLRKMTEHIINADQREAEISNKIRHSRRRSTENERSGGVRTYDDFGGATASALYKTVVAAAIRIDTSKQTRKCDTSGRLGSGIRNFLLTLCRTLSWALRATTQCRWRQKAFWVSLVGGRQHTSPFPGHSRTVLLLFT